MSFYFDVKKLTKENINSAITNLFKETSKLCKPSFLGYTPLLINCTITDGDTKLDEFSDVDLDNIFDRLLILIIDNTDVDGISPIIDICIDVDCYDELRKETTNIGLVNLFIQSDENDMFFSIENGEDIVCYYENELNYDYDGFVEIGCSYDTGELYRLDYSVPKTNLPAVVNNTVDNKTNDVKFGSMATTTDIKKKDDNLVTFTFEKTVLEEVLEEMKQKTVTDNDEEVNEELTLEHFVNKTNSAVIGFISCSTIEESIATIIQLYKKFIHNKPVISESFTQPFNANNSVCGGYIQTAKSILEDKTGNGKVYICVVESEIRRQLMLQGYDSDVDEVYHIVEYKDIVKKFT